MDFKALQLLDYPKVVKKPMDLGTIQGKLLNGSYGTLREVGYALWFRAHACGCCRGIPVIVTPAVCDGRGACVVERVAVQQRPVAHGVRLLARSICILCCPAADVTFPQASSGAARQGRALALFAISCDI